MNTSELWIAILASITSLIVAVISLIATIVNSKQSAWSAKELENLKHNFSQVDARLLLNDEQLKESLGSLKVALQSIQRMKDEILLILSAFETSLDSKTAMERIKVAREKLFADYEQAMAEMDDAESKVFHRAKNQTLTIESFLQSTLKGKKFVSLLSFEEKTVLREYRNDLTDIQYALRDRRAEKLTQRIQHYDR